MVNFVRSGIKSGMQKIFNDKFSTWLLKLKKDNLKQNDHDSKEQSSSFLIVRKNHPSFRQRCVYNITWGKSTKQWKTTRKQSSNKFFIGCPKHTAKILHDEPCDYWLVPWKEYCKIWHKRTDIYCHFQAFCRKNTLEDVGFSVYRLLYENVCSFEEEAFIRFEPSFGDKMLYQHVFGHEKPTHEGRKPISTSADRKKIIIHAAAKRLQLTHCH